MMAPRCLAHHPRALVLPVRKPRALRLTLFTLGVAALVHGLDIMAAAHGMVHPFQGRALVAGAVSLVTGFGVAVSALRWRFTI
jgi:hypothetical protein